MINVYFVINCYSVLKIKIIFQFVIDELIITNLYIKKRIKNQLYNYVTIIYLK